MSRQRILTVEEHLSATEIAARLHVDESTFYRLVKKHRIGGKVVLGKRCVRWPARVVNALLEAQTV